jgi:uncharacterized membrane protein
MGSLLTVGITTFFASAVEAIEMVAIVTGVGVLRGWRWALIGAAAGAAVLVVVVAIFGFALTAIPIGALRLVVGSLLLVFGMNWLRKGITRVAAHGFQGSRIGMPAGLVGEEVIPEPDWTGFVLSFKGVLLEGLEVAFIVVTFGSTSRELGAATIGGVTAIVLIGALGVALQPLVRRIPRSVLLMVVGLLLTSFGTFWSVEGLGVDWPGSDAAIPALIAFYVVLAFAAIQALRDRGREPVAQAATR